jgi:hypothetical protein
VRRGAPPAIVLGLALAVGVLTPAFGAAAPARAAVSTEAADAAGDPVLRIVDACRAKLDARSDLGVERVQRRCPELLGALDRAPWRALLPKTLRQEDISADSLGALSQLIRQSQVTSTPAVKLDDGQLARSLAALGEQGQEGATRWERLKRWIKARFDTRKRDDEPGWIDKLASRIRTSEGIIEAVTYLGYAAVALLVVYVIAAELRAAGMLGGLRRSTARRNPAAEWRRRLMLADVAAAPLAERPGMLLRLLGEALTRANRLPAADGLTANAIVRRARIEDEERADLARVARIADAARFAPARPDETALEETVGVAKSLLVRFAGRKR